MATTKIDESLFNHDVVEIDKGKVVRVYGKGMTIEQATRCVESLRDMQTRGIARPLKTATSQYGIRKTITTVELLEV